LIKKGVPCLDLLLVIDVTKKFISEYEMNEHMETMQGNNSKA